MSKYSNKKTRCLSGHVHDSKLESGYCDRLLAMKQKGEVLEYQIQAPFPIKVNNHLICEHVVDFLVELRASPSCASSRFEIHETKGYRTAVWRLKYKLMQALYPEVPYRIINLNQKRRDPWKGLTNRKRRMKILAIKVS